MSVESQREMEGRREELLDAVVQLIISKHGGFSDAGGWIDLTCWHPGQILRVDMALKLNDAKILVELLELPQGDGLVEEFPFDKYREIKANLEKQVKEIP